MGPVGVGTADLDRARAAGYGMLAILVDHGVRNSTRDLALLSPRLAVITQACETEQLAADHCHVFDLSAPAIEGLMVDPEGRAGGRAGARVRSLLRRLGVEWSPGDEPESLSAQLRVLSRLSGADAAPLLDHLLAWLVPYEAAVIRTERALPTALVAEIVELALFHRGELNAVGPLVLPELHVDRLDLDHADTDLHAIAEYLARPAASGVLLTRDDITRVGRAARVPRGFGDRARMVFNLLRTGAELGELAGIARGLAEIVGHHADHLETRLGGLEVAHGYLDRWRARLQHTAEVCRRLEAAAGD